MRAKGHVVEPGHDLGQPRENEESSERDGSRVSRSVLEVRGVVRACFGQPMERQESTRRYIATGLERAS